MVGLYMMVDQYYSSSGQLKRWTVNHFEAPSMDIQMQYRQDFKVSDTLQHVMRTQFICLFISLACSGSYDYSRIA